MEKMDLAHGVNRIKASCIECKFLKSNAYFQLSLGVA